MARMDVRFSLVTGARLESVTVRSCRAQAGQSAHRIPRRRSFPIPGNTDNKGETNGKFDPLRLGHEFRIFRLHAQHWRSATMRSRPSLLGLLTGDEKLTAELGRVDTGRRELENLIAADAKTLVDKLRGGLDWALHQVAGARAHTAAAKLGGSVVETAVAEVALASVRAEIEHAEAQLSDLHTRRAGLVMDALRESAAGVFEDYQVAMDNLRQGMVALAGLERFMGVQRLGRTVAIVPSYIRENGLPETPVIAPEREIVAALAVWQRFAAALDKDPAAPIGLLVFPEIKDSEDQNTVYSDLTPIERSIVDMRFAAAS